MRALEWHLADSSSGAGDKPTDDGQEDVRPYQ